ncbi:MAG TPA: hypothetical protein VMW27_24345 [Thermoanaerobaculia bacterium]|nr:hypothetical protein [Thermoanaerobaculia bacterium]
MDEITIKSFTGQWQVVQTQIQGEGDLTRSLLAEEESFLEIEEIHGTCRVAWTDQNKAACRIEPRLKYDDKLWNLKVDAPSLQVDQKEHSLLSAQVRLGVIVTFVSSIGNGNTGTIIAEAQPVGEGGPGHRGSSGWRRWLRRLIHRLDEILAEERNAD